MKIHRKIVAFFRRTFVADCPHCHQHFYGFHPYEQHVTINKKPYRFVCHRCASLKDDKNEPGQN